MEPVAPQPPIAPVALPVSTPTPALPSPKKSNGLVWVLFFLVFLLSVVVAFFVYQNIQLRQQLITSPAPTSSVIPSPTVDPTADWATFENTKYLYSFKYPSYLTVVGGGMDGSFPETKTDVVVIYNDAKNFPDEPRFSVGWVSDTEGKTLEQRAREHFNKIVNYPNPNQKIKTEIVSGFSATKFLGLGAYTFTIKGNLYIDGSSEGISQERERQYIWVERESNCYLIRADGDDTINQILSTFKFTN